jgi:hypothetical protein
MAVVLRDVTIGGYPYAFSIDHGRRKLGLPETPIEPDDVPIMPGESVTMKIPEAIVKAYEETENWDVGPDPKKIEIEMQVINFGDGTSFQGTKGKLWHAKPKERSSNEPRSKESPGGCKTDTGALKIDSSGRFLEAIYSASPARILRANFLLPVKVTASTSSPLRDDCGCHTVYGCKWGYFGESSCPCDQQFRAVVFAGGCGNFGQCLTYETRIEPCITQFNWTQQCMYDRYSGNSCTLEDPTPSPPPTPTG